MIEDIINCEINEDKIAPTALLKINELKESGVNYFEIAQFMTEETVNTTVSLHGVQTTKDKIYKSILNELHSILCGGDEEHQSFRAKIKGHLGETIAAISGFIAAKLGVESTILLPIIVVVIKGIRNISNDVTCEILKENLDKYK